MIASYGRVCSLVSTCGRVWSGSSDRTMRVWTCREDELETLTKPQRASKSASPPRLARSTGVRANAAADSFSLQQEAPSSLAAPFVNANALSPAPAAPPRKRGFAQWTIDPATFLPQGAPEEWRDATPDAGEGVAPAPSRDTPLTSLVGKFRELHGTPLSGEKASRGFSVDSLDARRELFPPDTVQPRPLLD